MVENIVLITVDCLRFDAVSCFSCKKNTTPNIDSIAKDGVKFNSCFANGGRTYSSFPSLLGSIYHSMYDGSRFPPSVALLPELFSQSGYKTIGLNAANPNLTEEFGYNAGFDHFADFIFNSDLDINYSQNSNDQDRDEDLDGQGNRLNELIRNNRILYKIAKRAYVMGNSLFDPYRKSRNYIRYLRGETPNALSTHISPSAGNIMEKVREQAVPYLSDNKPFLLWLHFMDPHSWYDPDTQYLTDLYDDISRRKRFKANRALMSASPFSGDPDISAVKKHLPTLKKLYHATVREVDSAIGELLDLLSQIGKDETTALCFTSDHGEAFLEHGTVQHDGGVYSELTHVPLIIQSPELSAETIEWPCQLADIPPTLAALGDISVPDYYIGRNLVQAINQSQQLENPIISINPDGEPHIAARDSQTTVVKSKEEVRFFNRVETPFEQESCQPEGDIQEKLQRGIQKYNDKVSASDLQSEKVKTNKEIRERLEDLGYM